MFHFHLCTFTADAQRAYAELERLKDSDLALKDLEIAEHKRRMERMGEDFATMLQETLAKMGEKIAISTHWDVGQDAPVVRTFEDHALLDDSNRPRAGLNAGLGLSNAGANAGGGAGGSRGGAAAGGQQGRQRQWGGKDYK